MTLTSRTFRFWLSRYPGSNFSNESGIFWWWFRRIRTLPLRRFGRPSRFSSPARQRLAFSATRPYGHTLAVIAGCRRRFVQCSVGTGELLRAGGAIVRPIRAGGQFPEFGRLTVPELQYQ